MNQAEAYAEPVHGGYHGFFRLDWRTEYFVVRTRAGGEVVHFASAAEAECAAWRVMRKIEERRMVRSGPKMSDARAAAEAYFVPRVVRQRGKTATVAVERRKAKALQPAPARPVVVKPVTQAAPVDRNGSITGAVFGDPPVGRSALDQRKVTA